MYKMSIITFTLFVGAGVNDVTFGINPLLLFIFKLTALIDVSLGDNDGFNDGDNVGFSVGTFEGDSLGVIDGDIDGEYDGN